MSKGHGSIQRSILERLHQEKGQMWQADLIERIALESGADINVVGASVRRAVGQLSRAGLLEVQRPPHARTSQLRLIGFKEKTTAQLLLSFKSNEWYTPPHLIEAVREVLGTIGLDPASNPVAQKWIRATQYYTVNDDGLNQTWRNRVFLNPPYGRRNLKAEPPVYGASVWFEKLVQDYEAGCVIEAVALGRGDSRGQKLLESKATKCVLSSRIRFYNSAGVESSKPIPGCAFYYLGANDLRFQQVFSTVALCSRAV